MRWKWGVVLFGCVGVILALCSVVATQGRTRGPLTVDEVERLIRGQVSPARIVTIIEEEGIGFEWTGEIRTRLRNAGADESDWYDGERKSRAVRGGSWLDTPRLVRIPNRDRYGPSFHYAIVGFRCVQ
jgi:hypothetical protein